MNKEKEKRYKQFVTELNKLMDMVILEHKIKGKKIEKQLTLLGLLYMAINLEK